MKSLNIPKQASVKLAASALIVFLMAAVLSACTTPNTTRPTVTLPAVNSSLTPLQKIEPTLTPASAPLASDGNAIRFEEGKYQRDENCSRVFDYHKTTYDPLTIILADNLVDAQDQQELARKVIDVYESLRNTAPVSISQPITVIVLSNPNVGECYSTENFVFVSPDELDSEAFTEQLLGAAAGIHEYWILYGLSALALDKQPDNEKLKTWYQNTDDLDLVGLFPARFIESWVTDEEFEIASMSAASLVEYALEVEKIRPDELGEQVNNEVRTRWLKSLGVDRTVTYPYDGHFAGFFYSEREKCELYIKTDSMYFCLNRTPNHEYFDDVSDAEFFIDDAYYGRKALAEYILAEAPSVNHLMDPEETISFEVRDLGGRLGYAQGNTISLAKSAVYYDILHEIVHTFEWNSTLLLDDDTLWMGEGFAEYLGTLLNIYPQTAKRAVYEDMTRLNDVETSDFPGTTYWYYLDPEQFTSAKAWYLAQGGKMENEEAVDPRIYTDAVSFATMYRDAHSGARGVPIGIKYEYLVPGFELKDQDGMELSYTQAASFLAWLCDTYTLDRVLDVYVNGAENGLLDGKTYDELKSTWQDDLRAKGAGIVMPDQH